SICITLSPAAKVQPNRSTFSSPAGLRTRTDVGREDGSLICPRLIGPKGLMRRCYPRRLVTSQTPPGQTSLRRSNLIRALAAAVDPGVGWGQAGVVSALAKRASDYRTPGR